MLKLLFCTETSMGSCTDQHNQVMGAARSVQGLPSQRCGTQILPELCNSVCEISVAGTGQNKQADKLHTQTQHPLV